MSNIAALRIVFMGTPDFAVASLATLVNAGCTIVAVITAPDKPAGRGLKITQSAVKTYAIENGLFVLQPEKLKNADFLAQLKLLNADLQVVVAFRMLPEVVWNMPPLGTINVHGSLLPQYRGAAPINWAIINGETQTGVTTFKLQHQIDTGNVLLQTAIPVEPEETAGELHDKLKAAGAVLLLETINQLVSGTLKEAAQPDEATANEQLKHAPKLFTENCTINWSKSCAEIHNFIRGLSPYPGAISQLHDSLIKIYRSNKEIINHGLPTGQMETDGKTFLKFACADGFIHALEIQPEGKKRMLVTDFLRGYRGVIKN